MTPPMFATYFKLVASMALWGGTWVAGRVLAQSLHPLPAAFLRFTLASVILMLACRRIQGRFPRLEPRRIPGLLFLGATGVFLYSYCFFLGLQTMTASRAVLIVACIPVCIALCSAAIFRERLGPQRIAGALVSLSGVFVVIADGSPMALLATGSGFGAGDALILGCVASWTAYSVAGKAIMRDMSPLTAVTWSCVFGALLLFFPALFSELVPDISRAGWLDWVCLAYLGVLATSYAFVWYYQAISIIGPARSGVFINLVPVFAVILGFLLLGETLHLSVLAGGAMVVLGVWLTNRA
ncbi:MAG: DMT family transporter [Desulfovibrionaceae bacterium]